MHLARPSFSTPSLLPLLIALALVPPGAHAGPIPLRLIADPAGENDGREQVRKLIWLGHTR